MDNDIKKVSSWVEQLAQEVKRKGDTRSRCICRKALYISIPSGGIPCPEHPHVVIRTSSP